MNETLTSWERGCIGEQTASELLIKDGFTIIEKGTSLSAYDLIAEKDGTTYVINVKTGQVFGIHKTNLNRIIRLCQKTKFLPAIFIQADKEHYALFVAKNFTWHDWPPEALLKKEHIRVVPIVGLTGQWYPVTVRSRNRVYLPNDAIVSKGIKQGQTVYIQIAVEVEAKKP